MNFPSLQSRRLMMSPPANDRRMFALITTASAAGDNNSAIYWKNMVRKSDMLNYGRLNSTEMANNMESESCLLDVQLCCAERQ